MQVNSSDIIIDGVNHCDAFGKVDDEMVFVEKGFPCPTFSNTYGNISLNDNLPFLGGGNTNGTVQIRNFEWLEGVTQTTTTTMTTTTITTADSITEKIIMIPYEQDKIDKHKGKLMHR